MFEFGRFLDVKVALGSQGYGTILRTFPSTLGPKDGRRTGFGFFNVQSAIGLRNNYTVPTMPLPFPQGRRVVGSELDRIEQADLLDIVETFALASIQELPGQAARFCTVDVDKGQPVRAPNTVFKGRNFQQGVVRH